jgi:hypothetical protein
MAPHEMTTEELHLLAWERAAACQRRAAAGQDDSDEFEELLPLLNELCCR